MTEPDTTALRALGPSWLGHSIPIILTPAERDALCDGYDEAQRLRGGGIAPQREMDLLRTIERQVIDLGAARQALADLIGELRGLAGHGRTSGALLAEILDRHDPETP